MLATPGIHTKTDLTLGQKLGVLWSKITGREVRIPFPLEPEMFSELEECTEFIRRDKLALHDATAAFFLEVLRTRSFIRRHRHQLTMPTFMACAGDDGVCDNVRNRQFFEKLPAKNKTLVEYSNARHILEFSPARDEFFRDLARWFGQFEGGATCPA